MLISLHLVQSKYTKIYQREIPSINHNVLEFFCMPLYTDFPDFYKNLEVACICDTNLEF